VGVDRRARDLIVFAPYYICLALSERIHSGLNIFRYFYTHIIQLFVYELLFGVVIGGLSSFWRCAVI